MLLLLWPDGNKGTLQEGLRTWVSVGSLSFHPFYHLSVKWNAGKFVKNEHETEPE